MHANPPSDTRLAGKESLSRSRASEEDRRYRLGGLLHSDILACPRSCLAPSVPLLLPAGDASLPLVIPLLRRRTTEGRLLRNGKDEAVASRNGLIESSGVRRRMRMEQLLLVPPCCGPSLATHGGARAQEPGTGFRG